MKDRELTKIEKEEIKQFIQNSYSIMFEATKANTVKELRLAGELINEKLDNLKEPSIFYKLKEQEI